MALKFPIDSIRLIVGGWEIFLENQAQLVHERQQIRDAMVSFFFFFFRLTSLSRADLYLRAEALE